MTLTIAWVRKQGRVNELLLASDSRLRFGIAWDACPKLFLTQRGDICFGFAGDTLYAYPLITQAINQMELHRASSTREYDIYDSKGHISRQFNEMLLHRGDLPTGQSEPDSPETLFAMVGYSWKRRDFAMWKVTFDKHSKTFRWNKCRGIRGVGRNLTLAVLGNPTMSESERKEFRKAGKSVMPDGRKLLPKEEDVKVIAMKRIALLVQKKNKGGGFDGLDMEPFEVLRDLIREGVSPFVAGPPQLIKMYPNSSSQVIGVFWPNRQSKQVAVFGRPLLPYERLDCPLLDPDSLETSFSFWEERASLSHDACTFVDYHI